ncbi:DUF397 domain-containing protein [Micromonospora sp. NPDC005203]|uniref:DUF397 domain-containing protein n=1 Tax=Micromonospora sp. NPDC005203 TaxID=3364226 RepID=UPI0036A11637
MSGQKVQDRDAGSVDEQSFRLTQRCCSNQDNFCVEVATNLGGVVGVRDRKDLDGPVLVVDAYSWRLVVTGTRR